MYKLLGGRARDRLPAYANGWYGGARTPDDYAQKACEVVRRGYSAMNFDPFGVAWRREFVGGWNPCEGGQFRLPTSPGLGIDLDLAACAAHPPQKNPFPSLWDDRWLKEFTKGSASSRAEIVCGPVAPQY